MGHLERVAWRSGQNGPIETQNIRHVFTMTGGGGRVRSGSGAVWRSMTRGFVKTGPVLTPDDLVQWALRRQTLFWSKRACPGVLAVGDVRSGSHQAGSRQRWAKARSRWRPLHQVLAE